MIRESPRRLKMKKWSQHNNNSQIKESETNYTHNLDTVNGCVILNIEGHGVFFEIFPRVGRGAPDKKGG